MIVRFSIPIRLHFVFTLEIFVSKVGRPVRSNFEIHSGYKLTCKGSVIFILKENLGRAAQEACLIRGYNRFQ